MSISLDNFEQEKDCIYKDEHYSVRDNGSVFRHSRVGGRMRPVDNFWTFGKPNEKTGYMEIASVRIYRIVATAFQGIPPDKEYVVDHIDTNRHNNRPENLRWVTRLENVLLNPITAKRIAAVCGSIEAFLSNPSAFKDDFSEPNYSWMCTVNKEEAQTSLTRMIEWANSDTSTRRGNLGNWIYNRSLFNQNIHDSVKQQKVIIPIVIPKWVEDYGTEYVQRWNEIKELGVEDVIPALTENAAQRDWKIPTEFPNTPQNIKYEPLVEYAKNIRKGDVLCRNKYQTSMIVDIGFSVDRSSLYVMTDRAGVIESHGFIEVTYEKGMFIHISHTFMYKEGAQKYFTLAQGLEWKGGETFDDYCM